MEEAELDEIARHIVHFDLYFRPLAQGPLFLLIHQIPMPGKSMDCTSGAGALCSTG
jgi:hypothetical protein